MPIDVIFTSDHPKYDDVAQVWATVTGYLCIEVKSATDPQDCQIIFLNKQNAIKFAKEVRKQISFIEEETHEG